MKKIILDTDMGCDCDDVGALAILLKAVKNKEAELLAVTHAIDKISGLRFIENMLKYYEIGNVPVCRCSTHGFMSDWNDDRYTEQPTADNTNADYLDSVKTMRKLLAENDKVTIVTIGSFVNISALLASKPDEISPLDGKALVEKHVERFYSMAGHFENKDYCEFNVICDIPSAKYVAEHCPVEIIYSGFEIGEKIITGESLVNEPDDSIVKNAYFHYVSRCGKPADRASYRRPSWDLCTVYQAIYPENRLFSLSDNVTVTFGDKGETVFANGGKDRYMLFVSSTDEIEAELNSRILR